jgi:ParB family chromosome partitioning protein
MKMEALKHQGKTLSPMGTKSRSDVLIAKSSGDSRNQIQRYIRLTELIPELSQMVDEGKIAFRPAVELSYLTEKEQYELLEVMEREDCTPSLAQSIKFKEVSRDGKLDKAILSKILSQPKANQIEKIIFKRDELEKYFTKAQTVGDIKSRMLTLLEQDRKRKQSRDAR